MTALTLHRGSREPRCASEPTCGRPRGRWFRLHGLPSRPLAHQRPRGHDEAAAALIRDGDPWRALGVPPSALAGPGEYLHRVPPQELTAPLTSPPAPISRRTD